MDSLNPTIFQKHQFFSTISLPKPKIPPTNRPRRNQFKTHVFHLPKIPFSTYFPLQISAQLRRTSKRRNSLRKKLIDEQKVNKFDSFDPNYNFEYPIYNTPDEFKQFDSNTKSRDLEEISSSSVEKSKLLGESVLWSKLENWVDQYKKENEFWGMGSGPVLTVFKDFDEKIEKVSVNEDEILRRSRIEPSLFKEGEMGEEFIHVKLKISHAKSLGREIETGEYKILQNSSVVKVIVSGKQSVFLNGVHSVRPNMIVKFSRIGFVMLCGWFVFWSMKKVVIGGDDGEVELTREEKEMLRRKLKSRREREELERGSVEILPSVVNPLTESTKRPQFDREELMDSIMKAKASGERLTLPNSSSDIKSRDFDRKVQEIKEMARRVRKLERNDGEKHEDVKESSNEMEDVEMHGKLGVHNLNGQFDGDAVKLVGISGTLVSPSVDDPTIADNGSVLEGVSEDASNNSDSQVPSLTSIEGTEEIQSFDAPSDELYYFNKSSNISRPMVIQSVKEARGYLSQKHDRKELVKEPILTNLRQSDDAVGPVSDENKSSEASKNINKEKEVCEPTVCDETLKTKFVTNGSELQPPALTSMEGSENFLSSIVDPNRSENSTLNFVNKKQETQSIDASNGKSYDANRSCNNSKPRVIRSVKEAREYLSQKHDRKELGKEPKVTILEESDDIVGSEEKNGKASQMINKGKKVHESSICDGTLKPKPMTNASEMSSAKNMGLEDDVSQSIPYKVDDPKDMVKIYATGDLRRPKSLQEDTDLDRGGEAVRPLSKESWIEKNFHELEPIAKKIGDGFRGNYMVAKEKSLEQLNLVSEINQLQTDEDDSALEWMKDDSLREIVFQVRENELMGHDPFHMMDAKDKQAFFQGLEKKVEKENAKLVKVHELIHSKIENLDYGADGISLYDPLEKVIPRWKGPPVDKNPEFLNNHIKQREALFAENVGASIPVKQDGQNTLEKSVESPAWDNISTSSVKVPQNGASKYQKTVIESSDGSSRVGKKSGKEYWQHTKKWSREFLEAYNAETDPEVKSIMKDMGKDLDRWITEKEIEEVGELMTKIPKKRRRAIEKKLDKLKREMEMFGPQAVVSKYREYADEEEEDYLWWLDLSFVLCIELYTNVDGVEKVGFYSLEMAADLELDPKQYHVIAFEDPGDCKSFCYIIQAHMEMLGNGRAFIVANTPKDAFREAKANGFSVTVFRKGELQLNVDQTLEEVEEQITEIGSKMYHDKIMRGRSMDISSLMKGVFGSSKSAKRQRSKRLLKKPPNGQRFL